VRFQISQLARLGPLARARHVVQQPFQLRAGEVGVDHQARLALDESGMAAGAQLVAARRRAAVLPDDRVGHGLARGAVPQEGRLPLVRDGQRRDVAGAGGAALLLQFVQRGQRHGVLGGPDFAGVMLHPAGLRKDLLELALRDGDDLPRAVEHDRARAGGSLVQGEDVFHGAAA
jgi:hypothetical protein